MDADRAKTLRKKHIYLAFTVFFAVVFITVVFVMIYQWYQQRNALQHLDELRNNATTELPVTEVTEVAEQEVRSLLEQLGGAIPQKEIDWGQLFAENDDIYAWIYIPGTNVDYPILQHDKEDNYYVDHNIDGSAGYPGCITTQVSYSSKDFMDFNTVIYGHNMKDGSMFHTLHDYEEEDFFAENKFVYIYLPDGKAYAYEIFAAYTYTNELIPYKYDFSQEAECQRYLEDVFAMDNGFFRDGMQVTTANHMITLSTCTIPSNDKKRYLVQAVLINDPTLSEEETVQSIFPNGYN